jgi:hypothetical protein
VKKAAAAAAAGRGSQAKYKSNNIGIKQPSS